MFAEFGDRLSLAPAGALSIALTGPFAADAPSGPENLVLQVATALRQAGGVSSGVRILLEKNIPAGAGLGGGSADAASALRALNAFWQAGLSDRELALIAGRYGSDIPMCLQGTALRALGTGERIEPWLRAPAVPMVLVWPHVTLPTGAVFAALQSTVHAPIPDVGSKDLSDLPALCDFLQRTRNDLTDAALALQPAISDVLSVLDEQPDCLLSRMSGSGSACFGIFADRQRAEAAASAIARRRPTWWVKAVTAC